MTRPATAVLSRPNCPRSLRNTIARRMIATGSVNDFRRALEAATDALAVITAEDAGERAVSSIVRVAVATEVAEYWSARLAHDHPVVVDALRRVVAALVGETNHRSLGIGGGPAANRIEALMKGAR